MNLELYCKYARNNKVECCLSEIMMKCNKHYIITAIQDEIPTGKCVKFDEEYKSGITKITLINRISLMTEAHVLIHSKHVYDPHLIEHLIPMYLLIYRV